MATMSCDLHVSEREITTVDTGHGAVVEMFSVWRTGWWSVVWWFDV